MSGRREWFEWLKSTETLLSGGSKIWVDDPSVPRHPFTPKLMLRLFTVTSAIIDISV